MARRGRKRIVTASPVEPSGVTNERADKNEEMHCEERLRAINRDEVERRIVAIQAIRAVETESLLSRLRLFRLFVGKDHLEIPALQFFEQNLPNLSVTRNEKDKIFELKWRDTERHGNGRDVRASLESDITTGSLGDLTMSVDSVRKNFFRAANMQIPDFVADEPSEYRMLGTKDAFQTPGLYLLI